MLEGPGEQTMGKESLKWREDFDNKHLNCDLKRKEEIILYQHFIAKRLAMSVYRNHTLPVYHRRKFIGLNILEIACFLQKKDASTFFFVEKKNIQKVEL